MIPSESGRDWEGRPLPLPDDAELSRALQEANLATLLLVYVHLTHDESMLDAFAEHLGPAQMQRPQDVPQALADDLRGRLREVLTGRVPVLGQEPSVELYQRMMSVGVGEPVGDEYLPLLFDQIGFQRQPLRRDLPGRTQPGDFTVAIIGAGMAGIAMAIKLQEAGYRFVILERNSDIGGTWLSNTYPGVGVDTPSHFYSFSFEIWPHWSHFKPKGDEMQEYFTAIVEKYGLRRHVQFETTVEGCTFDEPADVWRVHVRRGNGDIETVTVDAVVNAQGYSRRPRTPSIPGLGDFTGPVAHTAAWPRELDIRGRRVGVIGTGASGVQLVPAIADDAEHVTVFMRSRHWVLNNAETDIPVPSGALFAIRYIPYYREWFRFRVYWMAGDGHYLNVLKDPAYEGNPVAISAQNDRIRQYALAQMREELSDRSDLLELVTPDFPILSKRIISHPRWWQTLKREDVALVQGQIERIEPQGVRTADGTFHRLDTLVFATGFDMARMHGDLDIRGRSGKQLRDDWGDEDPRAYMGVLVPGYPNYFHLTGPNSHPNFAGGANIIAEAQVNYVVECLELLQFRSCRTIEVCSDAYERWNDIVAEQHEKLIWSHPRCDAYYLNSSRRNFMSWPFRLVDYWRHSRGPVVDDVVLGG